MELESPFGEDVIPTGILGKRNAEKILKRFLKSAKEKDGREKMKHTNSSKATTS